MKYRREIDGLRAVAVIPVIFFHAGLETFKGGFVGVDVFFVISGYLITTIILSEKERGVFSLVNFYERRVRRILPALFFVMLATWPFAWFWLLPSDMVSFSQSLISVSTFSSNLLFWRTSGYWGLENEFIPLLHTWSLAVEEQYYLLFPLFLMMMWRFRRRWIFISFVLLAVFSLLLSHWAAYQFPTANFFLLVTRGWELAIGAAIAFYCLYRPNTNRFLSHRAVAEALSAAGFLMISFSVFTFDETIPFPSFYALIPTVGTGLIVLCASQETFVGRLLGLKAFVGIGLVSYSAYLWHMPLFAFARHRSLATPDINLILALSVLSVALAFLSWHFVERPFRQKDRLSRKTIFTVTAIGSVFFIAVGLIGVVEKGWPDRFDPQLRASLEEATTDIPGDKLCLPDHASKYVSEDMCTLVNGADTFAILLGDSHAIAMAAEFSDAVEGTNLGLLQATERGCPPVQDVYVYVSDADKPRCVNHNENTFRVLENSPEIEYVILVARWSFYAKQSRFDNTEGGVERHEVLHFDSPAAARIDVSEEYDRTAYFEQAYVNSVKALLSLGKKVILVYPIPEVGWNVPRYVKNSYLNDPKIAFSSSTGSTRYDVFVRRNDGVYRALGAIGEHPNLFRIYPERILCNTDVDGRCIVQKNKSLLYRDDDHLSNAGAALISKEIVRYMN